MNEYKQARHQLSERRTIDHVTRTDQATSGWTTSLRKLVVLCEMVLLLAMLFTGRAVDAQQDRIDGFIHYQCE